MADLPYDYEVIVIDNASTDGTGDVAADSGARATALALRPLQPQFLTSKSPSPPACAWPAATRRSCCSATCRTRRGSSPNSSASGRRATTWSTAQVREPHGRPALEGVVARLFYRIINALSEVEITPNATDFRLLSRRAIDALNQFDERNRYMRGFAHWVGLPTLPDRLRPRAAHGRQVARRRSFYLLNLAANAITCFSIKPLQLFSRQRRRRRLRPRSAWRWPICGGWLFCLHRAGPDHHVPADAANLAVMLLGFGAIGEYIGRIYIETKRRPICS